MGLVYLFAFVVGLGILGLQAVMGGKGGADDAGGHHGHDSGTHEPTESTTHDGVDKPMGGSFEFVAFFLSLRFWIFAALGFGMSGSLLHYLNLASPLVVFFLAFASGIGSGLFASFAIRFVMRSSISTSGDVARSRGSVGRVLVPVGKNKTGQVRVVLRGQTVDLVAKTDGEDIARGEQVIIEEVEDGTAHVSKAPSEVA